jgi:hypothetical protein
LDQQSGTETSGKKAEEKKYSNLLNLAIWPIHVNLQKHLKDAFLYEGW